MIFKYISYVKLGSTAAQARQVESMIEHFDKIFQNFQFIGPSCDLNFPYCNYKKLVLTTGKLSKLEFSLRAIKDIKKASFIYTRDALISIIAFAFSKPSIYELHKEPTLIGLLLIYIQKQSIKKKSNRKIYICVISNALQKFLIKKFGVQKEFILVSHDGGKENKNEENKKNIRKFFLHSNPEKIILHTGSAGQGRGIDLFEPILKNFPRIAILHIGGSIKDINEYQKKNWTKKYSSRFVMKSHMNQQKLFEYQISADLLIFPMTRKVKTYWCCSPLKIFDYMSTGKNIICSEIGSLKEILNDNETFFFDPDDEKSLLKATYDGLNDPHTKGHNAKQKFLKHFLWEHRAEKIKKFISLNEN